MPDLPTGTVTFLFTDIEGSTTRWEQQRAAMQVALARHDALLRRAIDDHGGHVFKTVGDAFCAAFASPLAALEAALAAQRALAGEDWGAVGLVCVRMAMHTGLAQQRDDDYFGPPLNRVARLLSTGHGMQVLLSGVTQELVRDQLPADTALRDLGEHRLKDLIRPERIFQLVAPDLPGDFPPLKTLEHRPNNLPLQPTPFIGRERELEAVQQRFGQPDVRLLTLTGTGGTGKTRLALQVAADLLDDFHDGVWFINLAPITDPALVASTIASTLGVTEAAGQPLVATLKSFLRDKHLLLVLDNFEQVLPAAPLVSDLLAAAPHLKVLVTSRALLGLYGEHDLAVPPLQLPDPTHLPPLDRLSQYEAVRLFIERAQAARAEFAITNANAPAVAEICARLDGLPLAIELAAARIRLLSPQALLQRQGSRLTLLTGGGRDLPARHQTLRAAIAWSYSLLDQREQTLFARLAVFAGGCTLEAVEAVCHAEEALEVDVLDGASLVDKSLLRQMEGLDDEPRFTMLETIREYAVERLVATGEEADVRHRHASYYLALAEGAEPAWGTAEEPRWLDLLEHEHDNFRAALAWSLQSGDAQIGGRLAGALAYFWSSRGFDREAMDWLEQATAQGASASAAVRARALAWLGVLKAWWGEQERAASLAAESVALARDAGDQRVLAEALAFAGPRAAQRGDYARAAALFDESLALFRELGDLRGIAGHLGVAGILGCQGALAFRQGATERAMRLIEEALTLTRRAGNLDGIARTLNTLGMIARSQGEPARAAQLYTEALATWRSFGEYGGQGAVLLNLGFVVLRQGEVREAEAYFRQSLAVAQRFGLPADALVVAGLASVLGIAGTTLEDARRAAGLLGAADAHIEWSGIELAQTHRIDIEWAMATVRTKLDEATWEAAFVKGRAMSLEQAIAYALAETAMFP